MSNALARAPMPAPFSSATSSAGVSAARPPAHRRIRLTLILGAMTAIGPLTIDTYLPALPTIAQRFGATDSAVQMTLTGTLLGLAVGQLVVGPLSDRLGRRRPLIAGMLLHVVASLLCAVVPTVQLLAVTRTLQGVGASAGIVISLAIIRDLFTGLPAARLLSRLMLVTGAAPILAPSLGSLVLRTTTWNGLFVVLAVFGGLLATLAVFAVPETLPPVRRRLGGLSTTFRSYGELLRDRSFVGLCIAAGLAFTVILAYVSGSSFVLQHEFGMSASTFGLVFGLNSFGLIIASQLNPTLLRRWTPAGILLTALTIAGLAGAAMVTLTVLDIGGLWGLLVPLFVALAMSGLAMPNMPALALSGHGEAAGTAAALLGASQCGAAAFLSPLVGITGTVTAASMAVVIFGAALSSVLVLLFLAKPVRLPAAESAPAGSLH